jgi:hypothetical protein
MAGRDTWLIRASPLKHEERHRCYAAVNRALEMDDAAVQGASIEC